jgi:alpha-N-arabinofuranosidase
MAERFFRKGEDLLEEFYNLRDALYFGCVLNMFIRHADRVKMANVAQTVNVIAPIIATPKGSYYQPTFFPLKYYRMMHQAVSVGVEVESETMMLTEELEKAEHERYRGECPEHWKVDPRVWPNESSCAWPGSWRGKELALVDAAATRSEDGKTVTVSVVNRDRDSVREVEVDLGGFKIKGGRKVEITGPDAMGYMLKAVGAGVSDVEYHPEACVVRESEIGRGEGKMRIAVPAHGMEILRVDSIQ